MLWGPIISHYLKFLSHPSKMLFNQDNCLFPNFSSHTMQISKIQCVQKIWENFCFIKVYYNSNILNKKFTINTSVFGGR